MFKNLLEYLKSERGEIGEDEVQKMQEKIDLLESENAQIKEEKESISNELDIYQKEGKSEEEINKQRICDLEKENVMLKTSENDNRVAMDKLKIEKEFPGLDMDLVGGGSYEDMKKKAGKLKDFQEKTIAFERGVSVVDLKEEFKKVPGAQGELSKTVTAKEKTDADKNLSVQMEKGTSNSVFQAILKKAGMGKNNL